MRLLGDAKLWRLVVLLFALLPAIAACGSGEVYPNATPKPDSNKIREDLFQKLTASSWCNKNRLNSQPGLPDTSKRYAFSADGTYHWIHSSDYVEGEGQGAWNFTTTNQDGGVIFLDSGDAIRFHFVVDGVVSLDFDPLDACNALIATGKAKELPKSAPSALFQQLTTGTWHRTGDDYLAFRPTSFTFRKDGTYTSEYRYGDCREDGSWSLFEGGLKRDASAKRCDTRASSNPSQIFVFGHQIRLLGSDLALDYTVYQHQPWQQGDNVRIFESNSRFYQVLVSYPPLKSSGAAVIALEFTNLNKAAMTLQQVQVTLTPNVRGAQPMVVGTLPLGNRTLDPGRTERLSLEIVPEGSGPTSVSIKIAARRPTPLEATIKFEVDLGAP